MGNMKPNNQHGSCIFKYKDSEYWRIVKLSHFIDGDIIKPKNHNRHILARGINKMVFNQHSTSSIKWGVDRINPLYFSQILKTAKKDGDLEIYYITNKESKFIQESNIPSSIIFLYLKNRSKRSLRVWKSIK